MAALAASILQSRRCLLLLVPTILITLAVAAALLDAPFPRPTIPAEIFHQATQPFLAPVRNQPHQAANINTSSVDGVPNLLRGLWAPRYLPITAPEFTTLDGTVLKLPPTNKLIHAEPLGKRVCILDVDNRPLDKAGDIFAEEKPTAETILPRTAGFLSHYLYAQIHGYAYRLVRAPKYKDRAPHWAKVIFTQQLLKEFDIVVMMDYDAMFPSPEVSLEWLLNYWSIGPEVIVAMAEDPNVDVNKDIHGRLNVNTGFIIAQASEKAQQLFKDWAECPEETRYPGCGQWKDRMFHEQAGFSSYVRYDFLEGLSIESEQPYIRTLPCNEANGVPREKALGCTGQLVRHYWGSKEDTTLEFTHSIMAAMTPLLAAAVLGDPDSVMDFREKRLQGNQILDRPQPEIT